MNCVEARNLIGSYLDRTISDHECRGFIEHVRNCKNCYEELEIYMAVAEAMSEDSADGLEKDYNFEGRLKSDLDSMENSLQIRRYQKLAGRVIIAVAALTLGALVYLGIKSRQDQVRPAWETELANDEEPVESAGPETDS